jgi:hypothetical protein
MKKKPFRILEERLKYNYIIIELFRRRNIFSFGVSTSIGDGGIGHPEQGTYHSFLKRKTPPCIMLLTATNRRFKKQYFENFA